MSELTPYGFKKAFRPELHRHGLESHQLDRVKTIYDDTLAKLKRPKGLGTEHFEDALKEMHKHDDWKHLPEHQQRIVESTLKKHLGIKDVTPE